MSIGVKYLVFLLMVPGDVELMHSIATTCINKVSDGFGTTIAYNIRAGIGQGASQ